MTDTNKGTGRIAIKFGSLSASSLPKPNAPLSSLGKRPRPTAQSRAFGGADSDSDTEDDRRHRGKHEAITGFGADGAETERKRKEAEDAKVKKEYVIARQPNRDWRDAIKGQQQQRNGRGSKNILPPEARAAQNGDSAETAPADQDSGIKWGLTVKDRPTIGRQYQQGNTALATYRRRRGHGCASRQETNQGRQGHHH
ncbi:hypothetical protein NQ176_g9257 [Zarea fungicola]|uniref:Uncharacterized protein n=1 Tax=Zarea fungicola TaxID=93591 RepID=A0ACC1MMV1_9HYPO|nr:hypothetical protein NQ176_g9257 [Lecanicillium fungicola]